MKLKKILSSVIAAAMVLSSMSFSVLAEYTENLGGADFNNNEGVVYDGTAYYSSLAEAIKGVHGTDNAVLYCKPNEDMGTMTHGHVCENLTIYGNGAYVSGGEKDFEIDTYKCPGTSPFGSGLTSDVTLTVYSLNGANVWGSRFSNYAVNYIFENCKDMGKIFIMGDSGANNITMKDCNFTDLDGSDCSLYSNADGTIILDNVDFSDETKAINLKHTGTGKQSISLNDCDFINIGDSAVNDAVPVRILSSKEGGETIFAANNCTFTGTVHDSDILVDYGVGTTTASIVNTSAQVAIETEEDMPSYVDITSDEAVIMNNSSTDKQQVVAMINGACYATFAEALKATNSMPDGAVIDLLGNTVSHTKDWTRLANPVKITNGTIDITNGQSGSGYFIIDSAANTDGVVDFELNNIKLVGSNFGGISAVILADENGTVIKFDNVDVNLENGGNISAVLRGSRNKQTAIIKDSNINLKDVPSVIGNINVEMTNTTINSTYDTVNKLSQNNAFRNLYGTIKNSTINVNGSENGIKNTSVQDMTKEQHTLTLAGNTAITLMGAVGDGTEAGYDLQMAGNASLVLEDDSCLEAESSKIETKEKVEDNTTEGNGLISKAETIYVQFRNISTGDDYADKKNSVWEIVLVGANSETINELASVDLTFENNSKLAADLSKENPYTIAAKAGMTLSKKGDNRYMFSFDANTVEETKAEISLGTVTFGGYGELNFKVNESVSNEENQNIANATEIKDSIVDTFVVGGAAGKGTLVINTNAPDDVDTNNNLVGVIGGTSVEVPSRNLKINVTFPNAVIEQNYKYQDMVVTVKGTNIATSKVDTFTYNLGEEDGNAMDANGNSVIDNIKLSQNGTYTVTVTGAGYRTVSYDVHMTDDKELTFWNNVMDAPKVVEKDNADSAKTVTFLAGDIVKDDNINIYDLSAVVSYFATPTDTNTADDNRQYDLNRDGMIDSKDVAYVLVSWGK